MFPVDVLIPVSFFNNFISLLCSFQSNCETNSRRYGLPVLKLDLIIFFSQKSHSLKSNGNRSENTGEVRNV
jgi:hypothetical protein